MTPSEIKTVQVIDNYYPIVDGVVGTVHQYAKIMSQTVPTAVVAPDEGYYDDEELPYTIQRSRAFRFSFVKYAIPFPYGDRALKRFLNGLGKIDLVHIHSPFFLGEYMMRYAKKRNIPVVATFHSKYYDDVLNATKSKLLARITARRVARFYQKADSVWACSRGTGETLRSYGYHGDVFVMDNGSSMRYPDDPETLKTRAAEAFAIPSDKRIILFVGQLIWHKKLKLILDAFRTLSAGSDEYRLVLVGEGLDETAIKKYADSLAFPDGHVRFVGKVTDADLLAGIYLNADLLFFPSVYDNSPLVVREAASLGVPALLTAGSNAAEAVVKDVSGFTADATEEAMVAELRRIFSDEELRRSVASAARKTIPKTWESIVEKVKAAYADVLESYRKNQQ